MQASCQVISAARRCPGQAIRPEQRRPDYAAAFSALPWSGAVLLWDCYGGSLHGAAPLKPLPEPVDLDLYRIRKQAHVGGMINEYRLVA